MSQFKLGLIQQISVFGDVEENLNKAQTLIREAAANGAEFICLPEAFNTGYYFGKIKEMASLAEPLDGKTISLMRSLAKELHIYIMAPYIQAFENGEAANTVVLIDDVGEIAGMHSKTHPVGDEAVYFRRGTDYSAFKTKYGKIGMLICYDIGFPEPARMTVLNGAEIILVSIACRHDAYWRRWTLNCLAARAQDNVCFVAGACMAGHEFVDCRFTGSSAVFDPTGEMLALATEDDEMILYQDIDTDMVHKERQFNTVLSDRHPEDYALILK